MNRQEISIRERLDSLRQEVAGKEIMMLLHNLHEEGNTIVLITHDNNVAMEAPRQVQISDGKIIKDSGGEAEYEDYTSN